MNPVAYAQTATVTLTLEEALARAIETSHRLNEVRARERAAQAQIDVRRSAELPTVTVERRLHAHQPREAVRVPAAERPAERDLSRHPRQLLHPRGVSVADLHLRAARRAAARGRSGSACGRRRALVARADLRLEVTRIVLGTGRPRKRRRVCCRKRSNERPRIFGTSKRCSTTGLFRPATFRRPRRSSRASGCSRSRRRTSARTVAEDLKRLTGVAADTDIRPAQAPPPLGTTVLPDQPRPPQAPVLPTGAADAVAQALKQRAERQTLLERITAAEDREAAAIALRKPTICADRRRRLRQPEPAHLSADQASGKSRGKSAANVSVPLWDAGRSKAEAAEASANAAAVRERLADLDGLIGTRGAPAPV